MLYLSGRVGGAAINEIMKPALWFMVLCWIPVLLVTAYIPKVVLALPHFFLGSLRALVRDRTITVRAKSPEISSGLFVIARQKFFFVRKARAIGINECPLSYSYVRPSYESTICLL